MVSSRQSKACRSDAFDCFWPVDREERPKYSVVETSSSCFKSQRRRPMTWLHNRFPHAERCPGIGVPAMAAPITPDTDAPSAFDGILDLRATQAPAEGASHSESMHGSFDGSSLRSTAPRRLVRVHRLQSYSKDAHAMRISFSRAAQVTHSASKLIPCGVMELFMSPSSCTLGRDFNSPSPRKLAINTPRVLSAFWYNWRFPDPRE